jgi:hypothetical protein
MRFLASTPKTGGLSNPNFLDPKNATGEAAREIPTAIGIHPVNRRHLEVRT